MNFLLIRKINYSRDLYKIIDILSRSFTNSLLFINLNFYKYTKILIKIRPLLVLFEKMHFIIGKFSETFVLIDDKKLVGLITIQKENLFNRTNWLLCNAAVDTDYDYKNLTTIIKFKKMVEAAMNHVEALNARNIVADVRSDNLIPYKLCISWGFKYLGHHKYTLFAANLGPEHSFKNAFV